MEEALLPQTDVDQFPEGHKELHGLLVYDSQARLTGCEKIVKYFEENRPQRVDPHILFSKEETKEAVREVFGERAKERDFTTENDRQLFRQFEQRKVRFSGQRDFSNPKYEIFVPNLRNVLIFDSRFESGNLKKVSKGNNIEYNLWLENDTSTKGHTQWYYFKVAYRDIPLAPEKKTHRITFNILNLAKTTSLYQEGMQPCVWSKKRYEEEGVGWFRGGESITYTQNNIPRYSEPDKMDRVRNNHN